MERAAEGDVERHHVVDLVRERVNLGVVHLVRVELLRPLALLGMPKLVEGGGAAQPSQLPVVGKTPRERREIPVVASEPQFRRNFHGPSVKMLTTCKFYSLV